MHDVDQLVKFELNYRHEKAAISTPKMNTLAHSLLRFLVRSKLRSTFDVRHPFISDEALGRRGLVEQISTFPVFTRLMYFTARMCTNSRRLVALTTSITIMIRLKVPEMGVHLEEIPHAFSKLCRTCDGEGQKPFMPFLFFVLYEAPLPAPSCLMMMVVVKERTF